MLAIPSTKANEPMPPLAVALSQPHRIVETICQTPGGQERTNAVQETAVYFVFGREMRHAVKQT